MAAAAACHPDGGLETRREDKEGEERKPGAEATEDRISALPEALRLHVLCLLPLKSAIRTGALSTQWRELWTRRWPAPSSLEFRLGTRDSPHPLLETLELRGRRRLERFALSFEIGQLKPEHVHRGLEYATACAVEDLRVHLTDQTIHDFFFHFQLPLGDPHLTRLSIRGISVGISDSLCLRSHAFSALEVIHLSHVYISDITVQLLVPACPLLRTLDLRYCAGLRFVSIVGAETHLTSLTVAECPLLADISADGAFSLTSLQPTGLGLT
uniref:Uncharacterized protein n=1 Tax=Avena sativa TaxID=4498 RepID=A0ACD5Z7G2_AVESA